MITGFANAADDFGGADLDLQFRTHRPDPREHHLGIHRVLRTLDSNTAIASVFKLRPWVAARFFKAWWASLDSPLIVIVIMPQP